MASTSTCDSGTPFSKVCRYLILRVSKWKDLKSWIGSPVSRKSPFKYVEAGCSSQSEIKIRKILQKLRQVEKDYRNQIVYNKHTLPETNSSPLKMGRNPIGKDRIPTIHF